MARLTVEQRLERNSIPVPFSGCIVWTGSVDTGGYAKFNSHRKAHRVAWEESKGLIQNGLHVLHKCDVRCCVNPEHLFLGTHSDNMKDMWAKKRHAPVPNKGHSHPLAKLTVEQVIEIRNSKPRTKGLAAKYGVSNSRISAIRNGISWRHLDEQI